MSLLYTLVLTPPPFPLSLEGEMVSIGPYVQEKDVFLIYKYYST